MRSKRAAELLHQAFGLPVQRFNGGGGVGVGGVGGGGGSFGFGKPDLGAREAKGAAEADASSRHSAASRSAFDPNFTEATLAATRRAAAEAASFNAHEKAMRDLNREQQAARNKAAEAAKDQGFISRFITSLSEPYTGGTGFQAERDAASPGPDFDFLRNQALPGIAGLLPGVSDSPAGTEGGGSYYDAARLAMITGITVEQAQAYLDSMYGTA